MKFFLNIISVSVIFFIGGCKISGEKLDPENAKFTRLFCWAYPVNELQAEKYASAGVTDIITANRKQYDLARKYGMTPYWKVFLPVGPHKQVMSAEEQKHFDYISGADLDRKMPRAERMKILHKRRMEKQDRYGGDAVTRIATLNSYKISCFSSDTDLALSVKTIDRMLKDAPEGVAGIFVDFIGYMNHKGCYCQGCLEKYNRFLAEKKLADTQQNKDIFYKKEMIDYYNRVIDHIKSRHPSYKIVVHVYPLFKADPLYGNLTKADYCAQTVSWYFKWDEQNIREYTDFVLKNAKAHYDHVEGVPFIGVSTDKNSSLGYKTPEDVDFELRTILKAGGRTVMVCNGTAILEDDYHKVFKKYCGKTSADADK